MHALCRVCSEKKYQSLVEHIPLDTFVKMQDVLSIGTYLCCTLLCLFDVDGSILEHMPVSVMS